MEINTIELAAAVGATGPDGKRINRVICFTVDELNYFVKRIVDNYTETIRDRTFFSDSQLDDAWNKGILEAVSTLENIDICAK